MFLLLGFFIVNVALGNTLTAVDANGVTFAFRCVGLIGELKEQGTEREMHKQYQAINRVR